MKKQKFIIFNLEFFLLVINWFIFIGMAVGAHFFAVLVPEFYGVYSFDSIKMVVLILMQQLTFIWFGCLSHQFIALIFTPEPKEAKDG